jgi:hypothetical protein
VQVTEYLPEEAAETAALEAPADVEQETPSEAAEATSSEEDTQA